MIDIHTHILFGVDDGADDPEMWIRLITEGSNEGIDTFFLTPHLKYFDWDYETLIKNNFQILNNLVIQQFPEIKIYLAGEIHYTYDLFKFVESDWGLSGVKTRYLLLEFAFEQFPFTSFQVIEQLYKRGIRTIIAHPERIASLVQNKKALARLKDLHCLFQITAGSLTGGFGRSVEAAAWQMLENNFADFIASDVHHPEWRPFRMQSAYSAVKNRLGDGTAEKLFYKNQKYLILGEESV